MNKHYLTKSPCRKIAINLATLKMLYPACLKKSRLNFKLPPFHCKMKDSPNNGRVDMDSILDLASGQKRRNQSRRSEIPPPGAGKFFVIGPSLSTPHSQGYFNLHRHRGGLLIAAEEERRKETPRD